MLSYVFKLESEIIWNMNEIVFVYVRRATFIYDILTKLQKRHSHSHTHTHAQIFNTYINICTVKTYNDVYVVGWLLVVWCGVGNLKPHARTCRRAQQVCDKVTHTCGTHAHTDERHALQTSTQTHLYRWKSDTQQQQQRTKKHQSELRVQNGVVCVSVCVAFLFVCSTSSIIKSCIEQSVRRMNERTKENNIKFSLTTSSGRHLCKRCQLINW